MLTATYSLFTNQRLGYDAEHNGYLFAYLGVLGAVVQGGLLGRLLKVVGDKRLAMIGIALMAASLFALPSSYGLSILLIASTGISFGHSFVTPTLNGMASNSASAAMQGQVLGVMQSVASLARIVGPVMGGLILSYDATRPAAAFGRATYWTGAVIMLTAVFVAVKLPASRAVPQEIDKTNAEPAAEELVTQK
jgi:DHA1 family tetracycline resistance protein-like MFS transporter